MIIIEGTRVYSMHNDSGKVYTSRALPFTYLSIISSNGFKSIDLALLIMIAELVITLLPVFLLVCYPVRLFQQALLKLRLDCVFIKIFVERFYSCYKDGLDGSRDMRSFAGFYFLLQYTFILIMVRRSSFTSFEVSLLRTKSFCCFSNLYWSCSVDLSYETIQENVHDCLGYIFAVFDSSSFSSSIIRLRSSPGNANIYHCHHSGNRILDLLHLCSM